MRSYCRKESQIGDWAKIVLPKQPAGGSPMTFLCGLGRAWPLEINPVNRIRC
jgi:hypothetical protein